MLERWSPLQRQVLAALEVDCYLQRRLIVAPASASAESPPESPEATGAGALVLLVETTAEREHPLVRAVARALGARVQTVAESRPVDAVLVSIGTAAPAAALTLPPVATLRAEARAKQRSWLKIRSFLGLRRRATVP